MERCPECEFQLSSLDTSEGRRGTTGAWHYDETAWGRAAAEITSSTSDAARILNVTEEVVLREHPVAGVWSALEYACHIRDVLLVQRERVLAVRRGFGHEFRAMGRDERVDHDGYNEQRPEDVAGQLHHAALLFTGDLARLPRADWDLTMTYNFPVPAERSLRWVAVHTAHEVVHHANDMRRSVHA
jgi:hypothetical protein